MNDSVQLIASTGPAWDEWLQRTDHDFYHCAAYHHFLEKQGHGEAWLAVVGSRDRFLAWPYLLRSIDWGLASKESGLQDVGSVDGYAGPVVFGCLPGDSFSRFACQTLLEYWRAKGIVSVFCRFHPLLENHCWIGEAPTLTPKQTPDSGGHGLPLKFEGHTVSIDLTLTTEEAWKGYRENHRRHIRRARQLNLVSETDYQFHRLSAFMRLYYNTMRRNRAAEQYFYTRDFIDGLRQAISPAIFLHVANLEEMAAAAVLVSEYRGIVQYLFGGVDDAVYSISPLKLLLENVRMWASSRGNLVFHLGGGRGGHEDSLFYFKAGFSPRRHPFYTGRWILDPQRYWQLFEEHQALARKLGQELDSNFFPAYRAPFIAGSEVQTRASLSG